jgi:two-component system chemotaxis response regulator CheY
MPYGASPAPVILVVDDEPAILALLRASLTRSGCFVITAANGGEALSAARRYRGRVDLLVTDFRMPGINGLELYRSMIAERPDIHVLFITGSAFDAPISGLGLPLMKKPFLPADFVNRVEQLLALTAPVC